jgi:phosphate:Na+ symporter
VINTPTTALQWSAIITGMGGGLALFLYGMRKMTDSMKVAAGGMMKNMLSRLTANRFTGALAGALVTAVIQSSSVTTVLVVGFISAGLLGFTQSIGVILGANVGTTITAQIIAFKVTKYALVLIAIGFLVELTAKNKRFQHYGSMIMGLGLIFFGMELMTQATYPLRSYEPFISLMQSMENPLLGVLIGAVFTAVVQSSSATTGVIIVLAGQGFVSLETGIALIFGASIGTCVTAMAAAIGRPRDALRAAVVHVIFNVISVLAWFFFIPQFADLVRSLSPVASDLTGMARTAAEAPRQVANALTIFKVVNAGVAIWFIGPLAWLVMKMVPSKPESVSTRITPRHLDPYFLKQPDMAIDHAMMELHRLGRLVHRMYDDAVPAVSGGTEEELSAVLELDDDADLLHEAILEYLGQLSLLDLAAPEPERIHRAIASANYLEHIGDVIETSLVKLGRQRLATGMKLDTATLSALAPVTRETGFVLDLVISGLKSSSALSAEMVAASKSRFRNAVELCQDTVIDTMAADKSRLDAYRLVSELLTAMERIHALCRRIAAVITRPYDE